MSKALKPCPFCGGEAYIKEESDAFSGIYNVARCEKCGIEVHVYVNMTKTFEWNRQKVIERWNRRSNPWHTGTPTEQGWYVCKLAGSDIYETHNFTGNNWDETLFKKWRMIEP